MPESINQPATTDTLADDHTDPEFSRRWFMEAAGVAAAGLGTTAIGAASADAADVVQLNVGYSESSGRRAATDLATEVVYTFGFDALTIEAPTEARTTLANRDDVRYVERDRKMHAIGIRRLLAPTMWGRHDDGGGDNTDDNDDGEDGGDHDRGDDGGDDADDNEDNEDGQDRGGSDDDETDRDDGRGNSAAEDSDGGSCTTGAQPYTWGIDRVDADVAHRNCNTGSGADIAIIDTGIDRFHSDLRANIGAGVGFLGGVETPNWQDDNGHGTHCAGIADAVDNDRGVVGVSTAATLHAVKVLQAPGVGFTSDVARGIEWVADQGYDVGSLSLGGGDSDLLREACGYATDREVLLVAAAGNAGCEEDCVSYPAAYESVVAVSATTCDDSLAGFSSRGPEVELAAPGADIYATYTASTPATDTYATLSGTSMACPHVSGAGGQLMANGYSNTEARDRLGNTAEDIGLDAIDQGNGLLDVAAALGYDSSDDGTGNGPNC